MTSLSQLPTAILAAIVHSSELWWTPVTLVSCVHYTGTTGQSGHADCGARANTIYLAQLWSLCWLLVYTRCNVAHNHDWRRQSSHVSTFKFRRRVLLTSVCHRSNIYRGLIREWEYITNTANVFRSKISVYTRWRITFQTSVPNKIKS